MKIELKEISVRELTNGYIDNEENGVVFYDKYEFSNKVLKQNPQPYRRC